jgi:hypothetical protein
MENLHFVHLAEKISRALFIKVGHWYNIMETLSPSADDNRN